jgi:hypothetical protein
MSNFPGVDETAAPGLREVMDSFELPDGVIAACNHNAREFQLPPWNRRPSLLRQRLWI